MATALGIAFFCLLLEALFSSTEIAIVSADRAHIRRLAQAGHRGARYVEEFLTAPHRLLSTTLLGTQLAVVTSTVVITLYLHRHHPAHVGWYLTLGLTPTIVVFGEIVPKAIVRQYANALAPLMAMVLHTAMKALGPLVSLLSHISAAVSRRLGIELHHKLVTREEIETLVSLAPETDASLGEPRPPSDVTEGERSMISRIFDFASLEIYTVMVPLSDVLALPESATVADLSREIAEKKYSRIPIYRDRLDQIVGVVHAFEVLKAPRSATAAALARAPLFVPESSQAMDLLARLERSRQGLAVVVDEYGGAVGIVTVEDILEEVVGEIDDEYDEAPPPISRQRDGSYRVQARIAISQLNQELKLNLPEADDYESLGGLILDRLKHIPKAGETLPLGAVTIEIATANERRIDEVVLRLAKKK
jgi:CBS domain containing-hemolysin-like protein